MLSIQAIMTGGTILKVTIDPHLGGATIVQGGHPPTILAAGYIGSTLFGGVFILAGWDTLVAKIVSFVLGIGLIIPLVLVRDKLLAFLISESCIASHVCIHRTILLTVFYEGLLVGFWFIDHG